MINVLIVEDDPMVAEFNKRFLSKLEGYDLVGIADTVSKATEVINTKKVDLILLDVYMPGQNGLDLLAEIRDKALEIDVILITAASEVDKIQTALHYGAIDYLIKPFEFERFKQALEKYKEKYKIFHEKENLDQTLIDQKLFKSAIQAQKEKKVLPKGLTESTLIVIVNAMKQMKSFTTDELAETTAISRVSVRKYLQFLVEIEVLEETLNYGIGRPVYHYTYKGNDEILKEYVD